MIETCKHLFIFFFSTFILLHAGCKKSKSNIGPVFIKLDGSSTVFPISEAVAEEFQKQHPNTKVPVGVSGTGGGFKKFCQGEIDIADASRPIKTSEIEQCKKNKVGFIELPIAYDGLVIVANSKNTWLSSITTSELKTIWQKEAQGKITHWNHIRKEWPEKEIHLFGPGVDSGTYDYFTEVINQKSHSSRGDYTSSEDDNVLVQGVAQDTYGLGFFGYAYFANNASKLKLIGVVPPHKTEDGPPQTAILPSIQTIREGLYQPLSRPLFIYVSSTALNKKEVAEFAQFYLNQAGKLSTEVGYVNLSERAYLLSMQRLNNKKENSLFDGQTSKLTKPLETLLENN